MNSADRKAMITARAAEFFSEHGLTAQTRALARACGTSQRLLYRYFPSKAALVDEVYQEAILKPFKVVWLAQLENRELSMEERLTRFYTEYFSNVLTRKWLRLFLYSSLQQADMAPAYTQAITRLFLVTIVREAAAEQGLAVPDDEREIHEIGCILHGAVSHFAIRRHVYGTNLGISETKVLAMQIRSFLAGLPAALGSPGSPAARATQDDRQLTT